MLYNVFVTRGGVPVAQVRNVSARNKGQAGDRAIAKVRGDFNFSREIQLLVAVRDVPQGQTFCGYNQVVDMRQPPAQPLFGEDQRVSPSVVHSK